MTTCERSSGLARLAGHGLLASMLLSPPALARWQMPEFLILYSYGWPAEQVAGRLTELSARRIAAAHYNTVMCGISDLDVVAKVGLRCLLMGRSQGGPDWIDEAVSPAIARTLARSPTVWGYYLTDEPDNRNWRRGAVFQQLAGRVREYRSADPDHVAWINMTSATGSFLAEYMEVVRPDLLSFDLYRWWALESDWWRGLEAHRDAAIAAGVPMVQWIESNTSERRFNVHLPPPPDNESKIRWSIYTSLAYGSKGVQWFLGSINEDVARLNAELSAMGPTLIRLESKHVFHTSKVPREGRGLPDSSWYFTDARDLLIGEFSGDGEPNASYLLVSNKSIDGPVDAALEIRRRVSLVEEVNKTSVGRTPLPVERQGGTTRIRLHLAAGDGRLIRLEAR